MTDVEECSGFNRFVVFSLFFLLNNGTLVIPPTAPLSYPHFNQ